MKLIKHPADILTWVALLWCSIVLLLNFVVPVSWYFQYYGLSTTDVCVGEYHSVTGYHWARFEIPAEGVDHVVSEETNIKKDRFEWGYANYQTGINQGTWRHYADLVPGQYRIESSELKLSLFRLFPVYLNDNERPKSEPFNVIECEK